MDQYKNIFLSHICLLVNVLSLEKLFLVPTLKFKNFIQITAKSLLDKIVGYVFYALMNPFTNQLINFNSSLYIWCILSNLRQNYAFLLHYLYFIFVFFIESRVPGLTRIIKMQLNKRIAQHSAEFFCQISIFRIKKT